ncbi:phosphatidylcholine:ceramide cholinephosphotransferase 2-like [Aricia agestis]|uniref:phosphatidylcholine:ceramide cholinephosphotransferase 2-like n=1 Tax=Aricia agestis TaxID=91739 RepID=UPI001C202981|nr:phosphatidylcholine:ceramide cholinephosphotransferase 2-like [Aricia agestis]XP_041973481.1 phosphatidylcholine:ceramide cholinephosphotransferase 2-like [Aricia agestis]
MTISGRSPEQEPSPPLVAAEPLVQSVRAYLAHQPPKRLALPAPPAPTDPPAPPAAAPCDADVVVDTAREDIKGINFEPRLRRNDLNNNASRRRPDAASPAMPNQAELMQRQPLLARGAKPDAPPATDDSDPDHSPQRAHGEFVVELPPGAVREDRYPKEIWKTILSFFFLFLCVCINMLSLSIVHERLPDRNTTAPLNDIVLDNVAERDWGLAVSEYLIMLSTTVAMLVVVFHKHRFIVSRRLFFIIGLLYLYRSVTMFVTVLPVSSRTYPCSPKSSNDTTPLLIIRRMFYLISGFGLSINGKHTYCGDYIYSGHTMVLVLSYLIVAEYSPRKLWPVHWAMWGSALLGVSFLLLAHGHYTVDVVIAYYITTRLFWTFHSLLVTPHRAGAGQLMIAREWWYWAFTYLERNVRGPVPRRYDWPLPWPRTKLFSRLS